MGLLAGKVAVVTGAARGLGADLRVEVVNAKDIDVGKWEKERAAPLLLPEGRKIGEKQKRDDADPAAASS